MHRIYSILLLLLTTSSCVARQAQQVTLMLCPAGDARDRGRETPDGDERGIARQLCEAVRDRLVEWAAANRVPLRILLTHQVGEAATQIDKANYTNRTHTTLCVTVGCHTARDLNLSLYSYSGSCTDSKPRINQSGPAFCPYQQAHIPKQGLTKVILGDFHQALLQPDTLKVTSVRDPISMPMANLKGIIVPAISIDAGLHAQGDWRHFVSPLATAIGTLCKKGIR